MGATAAMLPDKEREEACKEAACYYASPGSELQKRATQKLKELDAARRLEPVPRPKR